MSAQPHGSGRDELGLRAWMQRAYEAEAEAQRLRLALGESEIRIADLRGLLREAWPLLDTRRAANGQLARPGNLIERIDAAIGGPCAHETTVKRAPRRRVDATLPYHPS